MKAIILAMLVAGCATSMINSNPRADFERDYYDCQKDASTVSDQPRRYEMEQRCMRLKGWKPA